ncbi:MAG TPA: hypothetical protein VHN19_14840 [Burkholderiales bacterium]|nr:hypothetical protein [Burkholderiales bacterium]
MKAVVLSAAVLAVAGCSSAPAVEDASPEALWGERMNAFRALADAKSAAVNTHATPFTALSYESSDGYKARRQALRDEVGRAQDRLDRAECALARARR